MIDYFVLLLMVVKALIKVFKLKVTKTIENHIEGKIESSK
jgi:hypothetical protein